MLIIKSSEKSPRKSQKHPGCKKGAMPIRSSSLKLAMWLQDLI